MTTALEGDEESASRPGRSLPPGKSQYPLYRRLGGPQGRSGQVRKISPPPAFDPRTVQPVASRYTDYATWPHLHKSLPIIPILSRINPVHDVPSYCLKIHLNSVIPSIVTSSKWSPVFIFLHQNPVCIYFLPHTCHIPSPSHFARFDHGDTI